MVPSVEIYDPRNGSWMTGAVMNKPRGYSAAAVLEDSLYVIGGTTDSGTITDTVRCISCYWYYSELVNLNYSRSFTYVLDYRLKATRRI